MTRHSRQPEADIRQNLTTGMQAKRDYLLPGGSWSRSSIEGAKARRPLSNCRSSWHLSI